MSTITFKKPFEFEGETHESVTLELENLKGRDITETQSQYTAEGKFSAMVATDSEFCKRIAALSASKPLEFFDELPANEVLKVTQSVQNFLLA